MEVGCKEVCICAATKKGPMQLKYLTLFGICQLDTRNCGLALRLADVNNVVCLI